MNFVFPIDQERVRVPPEDPRYSLRRVWLAQEEEEEEDHYHGFFGSSVVLV
jgi:hypothetical protein